LCRGSELTHRQRLKWLHSEGNTKGESSLSWHFIDASRSEEFESRAKKGGNGGKPGRVKAPDGGEEDLHLKTWVISSDSSTWKETIPYTVLKPRNVPPGRCNSIIVKESEKGGGTDSGVVEQKMT